MAEVKAKDIQDLLESFSKCSNGQKKENLPTLEDILARSQALFNEDYNCLVVPNISGDLCNTYPRLLVIPHSEKGPEDLQQDLLGALATPSPLALSLPSPLGLASPNFPGNGAPSFSSVVSSSANVPREVGVDALASESASRTASVSSDGNRNSTDGVEMTNDAAKLREMILKSKCARCRARFPVPSILYKGSYICRSSTLSGGAEMYGRSGIEYLFSSTNSSSSRGDCDEEEEEIIQTDSDWQLFDRVRSHDIRLLKIFKVGVIVDLMVEKKKVKFGVYVTSSEKVDKENRYSDFSIVSLPYPGCEFFKDFRDRGYNAESLHFNWNQNFVDAQLVIPERTISSKVSQDWCNYRKWDLVLLTRNYLKLLLAYIHEGSGGLLVHCISGWDRTPLYISLLRLSLWADGVIHSNLDAHQILYLTIAYDWMLFGHDLQDRLGKGEEIFFFCFYFLKFITSEEYSVGRVRHVSGESASSDRLDCVLLDAEGFSSAGSSNSLNSSCSSTRSSRHTPPVYFKVGQSSEVASEVTEDHNATWPYGSVGGDIQFMDMSPNLSRTSSSASSRGNSWTHSSFRERSSKGDSKLLGGELCSSNSECVRTSGRSKNGEIKDIELGIPVVHYRRTHNVHSDSSGDSTSGSVDVGSVGSTINESPHATTTPVAVPRGSPRARQESGSSVGSWQIISGTGSLRGSTGSGSANSRHSRSSMPTDLVDSTATITEEGSVGSGQSIIVFNREDRLEQTADWVAEGCEKGHFPGSGQNVVIREDRLDQVSCYLCGL
ncbi:egg-derived tyrosine phosphatase isoform X2 [Oratosquilla oratoria]|uniref:egg-derived tyrosine phosphatase isoform X2 n=1 Tax=Oratosquilla oratoria TaxID=337810 RepID=UPI003F76A0A2